MGGWEYTLDIVSVYMFVEGEVLRYWPGYSADKYGLFDTIITTK